MESTMKNVTLGHVSFVEDWAEERLFGRNSTELKIKIANWRLMSSFFRRLALTQFAQNICTSVSLIAAIMLTIEWMCARGSSCHGLYLFIRIFFSIILFLLLLIWIVRQLSDFYLIYNRCRTLTYMQRLIIPSRIFVLYCICTAMSMRGIQTIN